MRGHIRKSGSQSWLVRIHMGYEKGTGKRHYHNHTVRGTKKDAEKYLNQKLRELDTGTFIEPSPMTLDEYLDQWLDAAARPKLTQLSFEHYSYVLERYVRPALGKRKLAAVRPLDVQAVYSDMQKRGLSSRIVRYTHTVLSSALKQAVKWKMIQHNPAESVELPKKERKEMQALTPEQAAKFLQAAASDRHTALFNLAVVAGLRPSEYLGLQWKDVDFDKGVVTVQRTLTWKRGGTWYFGEPKTSKSRRSIPLPQPVMQLLREQKKRQAEERLKAGPKWQGHDLVFCGQEGGPLHIRNVITRHFKAILKRAGLPATFRLYDLRHTCATLLLVADENPKVVSERLGHSSIVLTLDTYSHVLPSMQKAASDKLGSILFQTVSAK
jgi:integrase